ncbi:DUF6048 family protein [Winogradskyella maritima]|uniref:DUF6048 family protein n=1 Tax=Winogradskyella maritima TaxID=1517766 RepID=A0ABV8AKP1_9FLAO|nr:DUF6048 family protein [Winogradskyella maritima]
MRTFLYFISGLFLLGTTQLTNAQATSDSETATDSIVYKQKYGIRLGADMSKLVRSFIDDDYSGFEIMGDYRLTNRWYLAGELGTEERTLDTDAVITTTKGSYFKAGVDYNLYTNWLDMENMIYAGFRIGASSFSQTLDSFDVYDVNNEYWDIQASGVGQTDDGLTALWGEILLGIKAEVLPNLFMGLNLQVKARISDDEPSGYENLYIPGFNRTYDSGIIGAGFGYNLSYLIPIYKKDMVVKKTEDEIETEAEN